MFITPTTTTLNPGPHQTYRSYMMAGSLGAIPKDPMLYGAYVRGDDNLKRD